MSSWTKFGGKFKYVFKNKINSTSLKNSNESLFENCTLLKKEAADI